LEITEKAIQEGEKQFGPVDCIVNNAGVMLLSKIADQDPNEWDKMIDVDLKVRKKNDNEKIIQYSINDLFRVFLMAQERF
jgi:NAD(P)-dependent dehydrogenase (short-subunit alcohol dehydrogenase family)